MSAPMRGRRWRAMVALVLLLPVLTANAALCALCVARHSHAVPETTMGMDMGTMANHGSHGCGREISDGSCPGPQLLVAIAAPAAVLELPITPIEAPDAVQCLESDPPSASLSCETPPPRA